QPFLSWNVLLSSQFFISSRRNCLLTTTFPSSFFSKINFDFLPQSLSGPWTRRLSFLAAIFYLSVEVITLEVVMSCVLLALQRTALRDKCRDPLSPTLYPRDSW